MYIKPRRKEDRKLLAMIRSMPCCICGAREGIDASHIKTRGSGGPDEAFNVVPHCRYHHCEWGQIGIQRFCKKYPHFWFKLKVMGWTMDDFGRLQHRELYQGA